MDNQYTPEVFSNPHLVQNIRHIRGGYITIHCNSGKLRVTKEATLKGYGMVRFDKSAITNIIYFSNIRDKYPVYYDTEGN